MRAFQFSKPKGPGFGISSDFFLSVLSSHASLPAILAVINPHAEGGAVEGFGVPLSPQAEKKALGQPLERGAYGIASKDRKTVLRMLVISKDEAGFDPEVVAKHSELLGVTGDLLNRIRATWTLLQLRFESHDPAVYPALDFMLAISTRLGTLTEGAIADPVSQRYLLPSEVFHAPRLNPLVDAREHVATHNRVEPQGLRVFTKGLQKFALPELEISALSPGYEGRAGAFLLGTAQRVLEGNLLQSGTKLGRFSVAEGGLDRGLWEGIPCYELLPPTALTAAEALEP